MYRILQGRLRTHRYLAEAMRRFNRHFDLTKLVSSLLTAAAVSKQWTELALRNGPVFHAESLC
jgi:hypothetical protein